MNIDIAESIERCYDEGVLAGQKHARDKRITFNPYDDELSAKWWRRGYLYGACIEHTVTLNQTLEEMKKTDAE